jgi:5-methylcytosine-specific restriction endonuclease McrA
VFLRDRFRCQYCGETFSAKDLTFEHVIPRSKGGETSWTNIVAACDPCNVKKDNRTNMKAAPSAVRSDRRRVDGGEASVPARLFA